MLSDSPQAYLTVSIYTPLILALPVYLLDFMFNREKSNFCLCVLLLLQAVAFVGVGHLRDWKDRLLPPNGWNLNIRLWSINTLSQMSLSLPTYLRLSGEPSTHMDHVPPLCVCFLHWPDYDLTDLCYDNLALLLCFLFVMLISYVFSCYINQ